MQRIKKKSMPLISVDGCHEMGYGYSPTDWGDCYNIEFCQAGDGQYDGQIIAAIPKHTCPGGNSRVKHNYYTFLSSSKCMN